MVTGLADNAARAVFAEFDKFQNFRYLGQFSFDFFQRVGECKFTAEINTVQLSDHRYGFAVKTGALQTDFIDRRRSAIASFGDHKWRNILGESRRAGNDRITSDTAELMDRHQSGKDRMILDFSITSGNGTIHIDDMISDLAVMSDMAGRHKKAIITDDRFSFRFGSGVNGCTFTENVAVTDFDIRNSARFNSMILGDLPDGGKRVEDIVFTEGGVAVNVAMRDQTGTVTDLHIGADVAERSDFNIFSENGSVHNNTGRMNFSHSLFPYDIWFFVENFMSSIYYIIKNAFRQVLLLVKFDLLRYFICMTKIENTDFRVVLVLDRLRSAHNTGNIFRIAEALNAEIAACGYTPFPPHPKLEKTAMGSDKMVKCRHFDTSLEAVQTLRKEGFKMILAAEPGGEGAWEMEYEFPLAIVLGNEALGVAEDTLKCVDKIVSLPMLGEKASINVGNAAAAIMYAVAAKNGIVK